jgi:hypothetical protein
MITERPNPAVERTGTANSAVPARSPSEALGALRKHVTGPSCIVGL